MHWSYHSLALSHWYLRPSCQPFFNRKMQIIINHLYRGTPCTAGLLYQWLRGQCPCIIPGLSWDPVHILTGVRLVWGHLPRPCNLQEISPLIWPHIAWDTRDLLWNTYTRWTWATVEVNYLWTYGAIPFLLYPAQRSCWGVYWFHSVHPSVCPSVRPSRIPCALCSAYSFGRIHFIFIHLTKQFQKVCRV